MANLERKVLRQIEAGDNAAFEEVFKKFYPPLYNYACDILKDAHTAEEIVEDTFLKFWENHSRILSDASIKSYLFRTTYNMCLNHLKHITVQNRYQEYFLHHVVNDGTGQLVSHDFPLHTVIEKELESVIEQSILKLPEQCRKIFLMSRYDQLKNEEIANNLNISINSVKTQLSRALLKMRESLKEFLN